MPVSYEPLNVNTDVTTTKTILHEVIPMTGTVINSGTYNNNNIKNYTHGMFQSVYDYPFLSSSKVAIIPSPSSLGPLQMFLRLYQMRFATHIGFLVLFYL